MKLTRSIPAKITLTGTLTSGSASVASITSTTGLVYGQVVQGVGIPANTFIKTVDSATAITLNQAVTATGAKSLTFYLEPVTLAAMKNHARVDIPDDDALINGYIAAARAYCESAINQAFLTSTWLLELDHFPPYPFFPVLRPEQRIIRIPRPPLQSVTSVQYVAYDGTLTTIDPSLYNVSTGTPGKIEPQYLAYWPIPRPTIGSVKITFVAGYGADAANLPPEIYGSIDAAIKLLVGHWYKHREAVSENGVQFAQVPMTVADLLAAVDHGSYS